MTDFNWTPKTPGRKPIQLEDMEFDGWDYLNALIPWTTLEYCAKELGVDRTIIEKNIKKNFNMSFAEYKDLMREPQRINILQTQYDVAVKERSERMLIWLGKQLCGQKEKIDSNFEGKLTSFKLAYSLDDEE